MLIIGIAGGTGSGKTTVVKRIMKQFREDEVVVLAQDSYYKDNADIPMEERKKINFDHPSAIEFDLLRAHVEKLKQGGSIFEPNYSYLTCTRNGQGRLVQPKRVLIVEGILVLSQPTLRNLFDIKVFVDADADDRLIRVIDRDVASRGRSINEVIARYNNTVKPMHNQFIEPSKAFADVIVPQGGHNLVAINMLSTVIANTLRGK